VKKAVKSNIKKQKLKRLALWTSGGSASAQQTDGDTRSCRVRMPLPVLGQKSLFLHFNVSFCILIFDL
jgi:hypothetical protein